MSDKCEHGIRDLNTNLPYCRRCDTSGKEAQKPLLDCARSEFEAWVIQEPYNRSVLRFPSTYAKYAWPGQYRDIAVQLAWEAWCESRKVKAI